MLATNPIYHIPKMSNIHPVIAIKVPDFEPSYP